MFVEKKNVFSVSNHSEIYCQKIPEGESGWREGGRK